MIQVFTPVTPLMSSVSFHIFIFISISVKKLTVLHIILEQKICISDSDKIKFRSIGELFCQFCFQIFINILLLSDKID